MATITKRGDTYRIRTSCGYDVNGKQVVKSMTYKPEPGMSEKQIQKELSRQAILFEENCKHGQTTTADKFEIFAKDWFKEYAEIRLKRMTLDGYHSLEKRVYAALGHIRIDRITPLDIQKFVQSLMADGLSPGTVRSHIRFVSTILNYAVKKRIITYNPCITVDLPKLQVKERDFYSTEEVKQLLELLRNEDRDNTQFVVFFTLAAYMGFRRGELLGLEWKDIDLDAGVISINRAYYYSSYEKTSFTDTPKTQSSIRSLGLPSHVIEMLTEYKAWQNECRNICGSSWVETDRLFTMYNGEPMSVYAPGRFLNAFCKRMGMRKVTIHSFRHFNASALIGEGMDVTAVQKALGHSTATTTLNIYSHAFANARTRTMEAIASVLDL